MEIHLMQHGTCLPKEVDPDMPLSPVGRDQIVRSSAAMRQLGLGFDRIVVSPKLRARQTAEVVAEVLGYGGRDIVVSETVKAMARPSDTVEYLRGLSAESVLIAGHLPNLAELTSFLLCGAGPIRVDISNGGLMRIDVQELPTDNAILKWYLTPMQLQLIAGR